MHAAAQWAYKGLLDRLRSLALQPCRLAMQPPKAALMQQHPTAKQRTDEQPEIGTRLLQVVT